MWQSICVTDKGILKFIIIIVINLFIFQFVCLFFFFFAASFFSVWIVNEHVKVLSRVKCLALGPGSLSCVQQTGRTGFRKSAVLLINTHELLGFDVPHERQLMAR